jgi:hypothetical protein
MSMVMIGAKIPPSWKELIQKLAREKGLEESEVIRQFLRVGMEHTDEVNGKLSVLVKEGEIVLDSKRALSVRRVLGHWGGHQSGWRAAADRLENPTVQKAYLEISEDMQKEVTDYLKERDRTKGKLSLLELLWDTRCQGCSYRIRRDRDFCEKNCRMYKKTKEGFELVKRRLKMRRGEASR